jgi:peptidyl-dipeptidase Dcp
LILSKGNTEDYAKIFKDFRGRDPIVEPMLVHRGLREN